VGFDLRRDIKQVVMVEIFEVSKSPIFSQKSPIFSQKSPILLHKRMGEGSGV